MKKLLSLLLLLGAVSPNLYATTWETTYKGFWNQSTVWLSGQVPDTTSQDTFIIKHPVVISNDLKLESGAYIIIEAGGGICGHQKATVLSGAQLITYGILELDELLVDGGFVGCYGGITHLTTSAKVVSTGARLRVDSVGFLKVGDWFDCVQPDYSFALTQNLSTEETELASDITVYPNPFVNRITLESKNFTAKSQNQTAIVRVADLYGRVVYETILSQNVSHSYNLSALADGMYILTILQDTRVYSKKIVKKGKFER